MILLLLFGFEKCIQNLLVKLSLVKEFQSVSYNLRHGGSALIDRKDPKQALPEIKKVARIN